MENKKNTILLTVIAVATLLVAVVGATFAYFTAQGGTGTQANVTVSTGTAASSDFGTFGAINIYADATTFAKNGTDRTGSTSGTVTWTAPGASGTATPSLEDRSFCYTAALNITTNTFVYSADNTNKVNELEFTAVKGTETLIDKKSLVDSDTNKGITNPITIPTTANGSDTKHKLVAEAGAKVSDSWTFTVTLKNLDLVQNENTGKSFNGTIKFTKVPC